MIHPDCSLRSGFFRLHSPYVSSSILLPLGGDFRTFLHIDESVVNMKKYEPFQSEIIDGDILAIILCCDLDSASAPEFDQQIQAHLDAGYSKIIIDCRN